MNRRPSQRRRLSLQSLETRRVLAASFGWDGPGRGSAELTYTINGSPNSLSQAETNAAIETALKAWAGAADITFTPTHQTGLPNSIDISFANIDGSGGTLAQAYFPDDVNPVRIAGDIQFDSSETWEVGNSLGNHAFDLVWVAVHEIGHALGLDHDRSLGSVLAPFVSPSQSFDGLSSVDAAAIGQLYAASDGNAPSQSQGPSAINRTAVEAEPFEEPESNTPANSSDEMEETEENDDAEESDELCISGGGHRRPGVLNPALLDVDAATLVTRFDTDGDATLSANEVPRRLWYKIEPADVDADSVVSLDELETFLAETEFQFKEFEARSHRHHHPSDAVFALLGRVGGDAAQLKFTFGFSRQRHQH